MLAEPKISIGQLCLCHFGGPKFVLVNFLNPGPPHGTDDFCDRYVRVVSLDGLEFEGHYALSESDLIPIDQDDPASIALAFCKLTRDKHLEHYFERPEFTKLVITENPRVVLKRHLVHPWSWPGEWVFEIGDRCISVNKGSFVTARMGLEKLFAEL